jgi:hypothetical protein
MALRYRELYASALVTLVLAAVVSCGTHQASVQGGAPDSAVPLDTGAPTDGGGHSRDGNMEGSDGMDGSDGVAPPGDAGHAYVVIAAAGDISDPSIDDQKTTSDLVLAGGYDAVLTIGDNQYNDGTGKEFTNYFAPTWGRFKSKIFPALGNHEYAANPPASGYFDYFFAPDASDNNPAISDSGASDPKRGYYSFDLGAWHLIALNTNTAAKSENEACGVIPCNKGSDQEVWLRNDLATHSQLCTLAYWHQARFTAGGHKDDPDVQALWDDLYAANADVILNGHDHNYQRYVPMNPDGGADPARGIVEFIIGTGGTTIVNNTFSTPATLATHENGTFGVLRLTLRPTGYDYEFLPSGERDGGTSHEDGGGLYTDKGSGSCH